MKCIIRYFEMASGLKVNFLESCCMSLCVPERDIKMFSAILNCKVLKPPFTYLGIPIGGNPRRANLWQPILTKMRRKLSTWKQNMLSFGGRLCLINSVLTLLPIFFLSFFRDPKGILRSATRIMKNFLWGGSKSASKIAWIKWDKVCRPRKAGGLGVRNWDLFNIALLRKWRWKLMMGSIDIFMQSSLDPVL